MVATVGFMVPFINCCEHNELKYVKLPRGLAFPAVVHTFKYFLLPFCPREVKDFLQLRPSKEIGDKIDFTP